MGGRDMYDDNGRVGSRSAASNVAESVASDGMVAMIQDEGDAWALDELSIRAAAAKALDQVVDGACVGLGSGHAVSIFITMLGERRRQGLRVSCVAASTTSNWPIWQSRYAAKRSCVSFTKAPTSSVSRRSSARLG